MRGLVKAAVVLAPALAVALVIPESPQSLPPLSPDRDVVDLFPPSSQLRMSFM